MITVEEAKQLLFEKVDKSAPVEVGLAEAFGCVLAEDVFSSVDLPLFDQSSMDGYAIAANSSANQKKFDVVGEIKAGDTTSLNLLPGQAVRIFTGAAIPSSADAVVIQEKVERSNGAIFLSEDFRIGAFIRKKGSQIKKGELALKKGSILNPVSVGFLASLGISKVKTYVKPVVSIIATGDEIVLPGTELKEGEVFESNSFSLHAALQLMHIEPRNILFAMDDRQFLKEQVGKCLSESDITILTGGISVGEYDFVFDVLMELSVETVFYKVAQKPGKPILAGRIHNKWVFALPGNPASALVCFYEYIYPSIRKMQGFEKISLPSFTLPLLKDIAKKEDRALFVRAKRTDGGILPLEGQDSNMLRSFAEADALIYIPMEKQNMRRGELVEVHLLPFEN